MCSRVVIQKSAFRILCGYSIFSVMPFRDCNASIQEFLIIGLLDSCSVLSGFSLSSVFWRNSIYAVSVILLWILCQGQLHAMRDFILYYGFLWIFRDFILWISALWISRDSISFASQSERADIRSVLLWHRQRIYMAVVQRCLSPGFIIQPIGGNYPQLLISWLV